MNNVYCVFEVYETENMPAYSLAGIGKAPVDAGKIRAQLRQKYPEAEFEIVPWGVVDSLDAEIG